MDGLLATKGSVQSENNKLKLRGAAETQFIKRLYIPFPLQYFKHAFCCVLFIYKLITFL